MADAVAVEQEQVQRELEDLLEVARRAEPTPLSALQARRLVRDVVATPAPPRWLRRPRVQFLLAAAALLAFMGGGYAWWRTPSATTITVGSGDRPLRLALRSGDTLLLAPGSELSVIDQNAAARRVRLTRGSALFEVAKLPGGAGFQVDTEAARVRVLGTIFSVEVTFGRTLVRVYEGRVAVGARVLRAPAVWASRGALPEGAAPLAEEARQLTAARAAQQLAPTYAAQTPQPTGGASAAVAPLPALPAPQLQTAASTSSAAEPQAARAAVPESAAAAAASSAAELRPHAAAGEATSTAAEASVKTPAPEPPSAAELRAALADGAARQVLQAALARALTDDDFLLLAADALRALGRYEEASARYRQLALRARGSLRAQAGFAAAELAFYALHDAGQALELLALLQLSAADSPLRERAGVLEVEAMLALGRRADAAAAARRYLAREPETATSARMRGLLQ